MRGLPLLIFLITVCQGDFDYCYNYDPQQVYIEQLMGMWYGIEIINHLSENHHIRIEPSCPIIHLSEDKTQFYNENPLHRDYNYGYNYGEGHGTYNQHPTDDRTYQNTQSPYNRDRTQYNNQDQYNRDPYNRDPYNRNRNQDQYNRDQYNRDQQNNRDQYNRNRDPNYRGNDPQNRNPYDNRYQPSRESTTYNVNMQYNPKGYVSNDYIRKFQEEMKKLRLWWDENGSATEYHLRYNVTRSGFWISSGPQNGSALEPQFSHFAGTVQVIKAVGNHLVLTFCHQLPDRRLYTILLSRETRLDLLDISGVHKLLNRKGLSTNNIKKVCNSSVRFQINNVLWLLGMLPLILNLVYNSILCKF